MNLSFSSKCFNYSCEGVRFLQNFWLIACSTTRLFWPEISERTFILIPLFRGFDFVDEFVPTEAFYFYPQNLNQFKSITNSFFFAVRSLITKLVFQKLWVLSQFWGVWINRFLTNVPIRFHKEISAKKKVRNLKLRKYLFQLG